MMRDASHAAGGGVLSGSVYKQIERSHVDYWSKGIRRDQAMLSKCLCEVGSRVSGEEWTV